jgi:hypothetical protein
MPICAISAPWWPALSLSQFWTGRSRTANYERMVNMADAFGNGFNLIEFLRPGL